MDPGRDPQPLTPEQAAFATRHGRPGESPAETLDRLLLQPSHTRQPLGDDPLDH